MWRLRAPIGRCFAIERTSPDSTLSRCLRLTPSGRWTTYWQRRISATYRMVFTRRSTRIPSRISGSGSTPIRPPPSRLLCASTRLIRTVWFINASTVLYHLIVAGAYGTTETVQSRGCAGQGHPGLLETRLREHDTSAPGTGDRRQQVGPVFGVQR